MRNLLTIVPPWQLVLAAMFAIAAGAAGAMFVISVLRELLKQSRTGAIVLAKFLGRGGISTVQAGIAGMRLVTFVLWTGLLMTAGPPWRALAARGRSVMKTVLMMNHYARKGYREFKSFSEYRAAMGDEHDTESPRASGPKVDDLPVYERALAVLGLSREEASSMTAVRKRYRELQSVLHPDKGHVKSSIFVAMVNEALEAVRKEHGLS